MPKPTQEKILNERSKLQLDMKIGWKMLQEVHNEEIQSLKKMEKIVKSGLTSTTPVTEGYLCESLLLMNKELQRIINTQHMFAHTLVRNIEKTLEGVLAVNTIIEILGDFAKESDLKSAQNKIKKLKQFQNNIIKKVKQKEALGSVLNPSYIR